MFKKQYSFMRGIQMLFIGVDLSDKSFDSCITNTQGDVLTINKFNFDDDGFSAFVFKIEQHEPESQKCIIGLENPHSRLVDFLIQRGYNVIPTHPLSISKYRESRIPSKVKSDPMDARLIADYIREHHKSLRAISMPDDTTRELSILLDDRDKLVEQKVKFSNQLTSTLKEYFPQALDAFGSITNKSALEFLMRFDTHQEVKALMAESSQKLDSVLSECGFFRTDSKERFHSAMSKNLSVISPAVIKAKVRLKNVLVGYLLLLIQQIEEYDKQVQKILDEMTNGGIFRTLPGADYILGARLIVLYASREFASASEAQSFWGTCPYTSRSGNMMSVGFRKGCNHFGRNTFHQLAFCSLKSSQWAKKQHAKKRKEGKKAHHALRCIANTWVKITYAMWRSKTPYDESKHLASIANHIMNQPAFIQG
jgi:transposase